MEEEVPILHVTGPQLAGKTYIIRKALLAFGERIQFWDIWDFYGRNEIIDEEGKMDWDRWREFEGKISPELSTFIRTKSNYTDLIVIESSGISRNVNGTLNSLKGYQQMAVALEPCPEHALMDRAIQRKLNLERVRELNKVYSERVQDPKTFTQKELLAGIQQIMHQMLLGGWCEICQGPKAHPRDLCCLPQELGWDQ